jgi:hypothetical protein
VTGVIKQRDICASDLVAKCLHDGIETSFVQIDLSTPTDQSEASRA